MKFNYAYMNQIILNVVVLYLAVVGCNGTKGNLRHQSPLRMSQQQLQIGTHLRDGVQMEVDLKFKIKRFCKHSIQHSLMWNKLYLFE